ncbi:MAG: ABC transporter permease [Actinomycetota bacterium]
MGRFGFVLKRLLLTVPLLFGIVLLVFLILEVTPGDPARQIVGLRASEEELQQVREELGLTDPLLTRYLRYAGDVARGDLGYSYKSGRPVSELIAERLPVTGWLLGAGVVFALLISIPLGIISAIRRDRAFDHVVRGAGLLGLTMPSFWVGIILILLVALPTGIFPVGGFGETFPEHVRSIVLPALTLAIAIVPIQIRSLRASTIAVLGSDYVTTARSMGIPQWRLVRRFVLRNAAPPTIAIVALDVGFLLFGAVVIETTFALPGIGEGLVLAARGRDIPAIQGYTLLFAVMVVAVYLLADVLTAIADPRVEIET